MPNILCGRLGVRKHPAPEGALRPSARLILVILPLLVRKHPAPQGALRPWNDRPMRFSFFGQKAPSTTRCIKTEQDLVPQWLLPCQKAPSTRRCIKTYRGAGCRLRRGTRKHPAPQGALRREGRGVWALDHDQSKALSTRRCVKTLCIVWCTQKEARQKALSTRRCIKTPEWSPCTGP